MKRKIFIALMSVLCMMPLFSQPYCDVRQFNIRDGLAANIISGIAQTRDELMNEARTKVQLVGTLPCKEEEADRQRSRQQQTSGSPRPVMRPLVMPELQPIQEPQYIPISFYRDYYHRFDDSSCYDFHDSETHEDVSLFIQTQTGVSENM